MIALFFISFQPNHFLYCFPKMFYLNHLVKLQHFGSKHLGVHRFNIMCFHRNDPIIFVVFFKPLPKNKTILSQNIINRLFEPIHNTFQNMWAHNVNMKVIINNRKTIANWWAMVRLSQCNLNFYSCKLHYLYCYHIRRFDKHIFNVWQAIDDIRGCQSNKLKLILFTFLTTLKGWSSLLTITQQKPYTLAITRNLNSILHHTQKTRTKNFEKEYERLKVRMVLA
jgi:hypothetical protein